MRTLVMDLNADLVVMNLYQELLPKRLAPKVELALGELETRLQRRSKDWELEVIRRRLPELVADGDLVVRSHAGNDYVRLSARGRRSYRILRDRYNDRQHSSADLYWIIASLATTAVLVAYVIREIGV